MPPGVMQDDFGGSQGAGIKGRRVQASRAQQKSSILFRFSHPRRHRAIEHPRQRSVAAKVIDNHFYMDEKK